MSNKNTNKQNNFMFGEIKTNENKSSSLYNVIDDTEVVEEIVYDEIPESKRIQSYMETEISGYDDFTSDKYPHSLNFYDFEVFYYDWCVTIINPIEKKRTIIVNCKKKLNDYYQQHKDQIWVGYNSRNYDTFILKSIILGDNPKKISDSLIVKGLKGWQIRNDFNKVKLLDFDLFSKNGSLKLLEGFMGNDIRETEVDFDIKRVLTEEEIKQTVRYNIHDVEQTIEVFRLSINNYNSHMQLIDTFGMDISSINMTQAQLTAKILECEKPDKKRDDEFDFDIIPVIKLDKYKEVENWFRNPENKSYKSTFTMDVCGVPHQFGWGGIHGAPLEPIHYVGNIYHVDVNSYYPSIMIVHDLLTRNCKHKEKYKEIYDYRLKLKHEGKKKEQAPYKIVLNSTYGISKDQVSSAFDPNRANAVCVNGQLMLLDLLEKLEPYINLIQSNTDGIILQIKDKNDNDKVFEICHEWENRTGMGLEVDEISEIFQKDVNNYIVKFVNEKLERKGAYVKELNALDYDLPIVNKAVVEFLVNNTPVEDTINSCNVLKEFQKIFRISSNYKFGWHNGKFLSDKTFRIFASTDSQDTYIGKCRSKQSTIEKFGYSPDHCFIVNENVNNRRISSKLDKQWYIDLAKERLIDFGINIKKKNYLF